MDPPPQRIMIVGAPGSGKSTLARALGARTGLPVRHIDRIHYASGWVERPPEEKARLAADLHAQERWIIEGGLSSTWPDRVARADVLIWLDVPWLVRMTRVLRRTFRYLGTTRPDLPDDCPERLNRQSLEFWAYIWRTRRTSRAKMRRLHDGWRPATRAFRLRGSCEVRRFVASVDPPSRRRPEVLREMTSATELATLKRLMNEPLSDGDQRILEGEATDETGIWIGLPADRHEDRSTSGNE